MTPEQESDEKPERMRLLCFKCKRWIEASSDGPRYLYMHDCGVLPTPSPEAVKAARDSATFMRKHMSHSDGCGAFVGAIYESDPRFTTLDEANREDESHAA
jgi:hypothetical protein